MGISMIPYIALVIQWRFITSKNIHQPIVYATLVILLAKGHSDFLILVVGTVVVTIGCWIFFEVMKRHWITRAMYGIIEIPMSKEKPPETI